MVANRVNGTTSFNNFAGTFKAAGNKISFTDPMAVTRMACLYGNGETVFLEKLKKVSTWSVTNGNILNFLMGDIGVMRFAKK